MSRRQSDDSDSRNKDAAPVDADSLISFYTDTLAARIGAKDTETVPARSGFAPIGAGPESTPASLSDARIGDTTTRAPDRKVQQACKGSGARTGAALTCEGLGTSPAKRQNRKTVCRILTNIPAHLPIVTGEVALIETYYPALVAIMLANDNQPDTNGDPDT